MELQLSHLVVLILAAGFSYFVYRMCRVTGGGDDFDFEVEEKAPQTLT